MTVFRQFLGKVQIWPKNRYNPVFPHRKRWGNNFPALGGTPGPPPHLHGDWLFIQLWKTQPFLVLFAQLRKRSYIFCVLILGKGFIDGSGHFFWHRGVPRACLNRHKYNVVQPLQKSPLKKPFFAFSGTNLQSPSRWGSGKKIYMVHLFGSQGGRVHNVRQRIKRVLVLYGRGGSDPPPQRGTFGDPLKPKFSFPWGFAYALYHVSL